MNLAGSPHAVKVDVVGRKGSVAFGSSQGHAKLTLILFSGTLAPETTLCYPMK